MYQSDRAATTSLTDRTSGAPVLDGASPVQSTTTTQLGLISFINSLPVVLPIERKLVPMPAEVTLDTPAKLNAKIMNGELSIGAMSSFFYLSHGELELIPGISISCRGPVGSVLLFSKTPLAKLEGKRIAVPAQSATSVNLLLLLLKEEYGVTPLIETVEDPDLEAEKIAAALVIGDRALCADEQWTVHSDRLDLGARWVEKFSVPMVFGLWAAHQDWVEANTDLFIDISDGLIEARNIGVHRMLSDVIEEAHRRSQLSRERLNRYYLQELDYELTDDHIQGLNLYRELAQKHGLLKN